MDVSRLQPARRRGPLAPLAWFLAVLDLLVAWAIITLLAAMVAIVSAQVLLRYGFNSSIGWSDEMSRLTFVWTIFLAIPLGIKAGVHIGIELITDRLAPGPRSALARLVALIGAAMMALLAWQSILLAADQWDEMMSSVNWSSGWFILPLAICGIHGGLHLLWIALAGAPARDEALLQELS